MDSLVIHHVGDSGSSDKVRFLTCFEPPTLDDEVAEVRFVTGDPIAESATAGMEVWQGGQFDDPAENYTEARKPWNADADEHMTGTFAGQFDDPTDDDDDEAEQNGRCQADAQRNVGSSTDKTATAEVGNDMPTLFPPGETVDHLKSIAVLKRKIELKRKAMELKEKLQRLGNANNFHKNRTTATVHRHRQYNNNTPTREWSQTVNQSRAWGSKHSDGDDYSAGQEDADDTLASTSAQAVASMSKLNKEELEERRIKAQLQMDITQTKHLVSKQSYLLSQQQKKVAHHEEELQQCQELIAVKRKELQTENITVGNLQVRRAVVEKLLQNQAELLMSKRRRLHQLQGRHAGDTGSNSTEEDEEETSKSAESRSEMAPGDGDETMDHTDDNDSEGEDEAGASEPEEPRHEMGPGDEDNTIVDTDMTDGDVSGLEVPVLPSASSPAESPGIDVMVG